MSHALSYTLQPGGDGPLLVLSHALGMKQQDWAPLLAELRGRYRVLTFDHLGHGQSRVLPGPYDMGLLIEQAAALLRSVAREPVVWVGLSMGGMVGQGLAIRHPELLRGLVVASSTAFYPEAGRANWDARIASVEREGMASIADAVMARYFHDGFRAAQPAEVQAARDTLLATDAAGYVASCHAVRHVDWRAGLPGITCPTLVIAGALDVGAPPAMSEAIADAIPGAQLAVIEQASHISAIEQPREFARLLEAFVSERMVEGEGAFHGASSPSPDYERGLLQRRRILGDAWVDRSLAQRTSFNAEFQDLITRHAWNDIWGRPSLGDRTRRFMVLSLMLGLKAWEEFALHVRAALDATDASRLSPDDIKEAILMAAVYCGVPAANHAFAVAGAILKERGLVPPLGFKAGNGTS
ncbi:alpha/beta fold hydrolase [Hydrogenophaga sp. 2FB]|uniref:alpha/beta fold hydrolase n=1 Tax=Hydrogenophaga sp. 2FB TaxID=2502187 RepID=UPI0014858732|nr:alpha/beta fold hydrolase [Hydrogenophaga sp. 2FB]